MAAKEPGAFVRLTYETEAEVDEGDAVVTAGTGRTYIVMAARRVRSKRSDNLWALRCVASDTPPPAGVQQHVIHRLPRGPRGLAR